MSTDRNDNAGGRGVPVLETSGLSCVLSGARILDSISISVRKGEFVSVLGPNGAGKSTLLKCIMRIVDSEGDVFLDGRPCGEIGQKELARKMGYVPQADSRYLPFTAGEFVMSGRYPHLSPFTSFSEKDREAVMSAMKTTGTVSLGNRRMSTLSGGEKQMVMIASVLAQGADLFLLDEPAAFLDPRHEIDVLGLLARLNRESGRSILMVTHDINHALILGGRIVMLAGGRIAFDGDSGDLLPSRVLERIYGRPFESIPHPSGGFDIVVPGIPYE